MRPTGRRFEIRRKFNRQSSATKRDQKRSEHFKEYRWSVNFSFLFCIQNKPRNSYCGARKAKKKHRPDCLPKSSDLCTRIRRVTHEDGRRVSVSVHRFVSRSAKRKTGIPVCVYFLHTHEMVRDFYFIHRTAIIRHRPFSHSAGFGFKDGTDNSGQKRLTQ